MQTVTGYSGQRACEAAGITYRQLDYWARTDLILPSVHDARGSGSRRRYSYRDLVRLRIVKLLLDAGVTLDTVRRMLPDLLLPLELDDAVLLMTTDGPQITTAEAIPDLCRRSIGTLTILPLTTVREDIDRKLHP